MIRQTASVFLRILFVLVGLVIAFIIYAHFASPETTVDTTLTLESAHDSFNANDFSAAQKLIEQNLSQNPADVASLLLKAESLAQQGSLEFKEKEFGVQAIAVAQEALSHDPQNADAWRRQRSTSVA